MKKRAAVVVMAILFLPGVLVNGREPFENEWLPFPPPVEPAPDPAPFIVPAGLYYVTDTYVADVVATSGPTTTYSTTTVHESTGTYARVIDTVGTGASSAFDGTAFNGRGALTDGRALAGTYYENFVLTASGYVPVNVVFFQDDSEARRRAAAASPTPTAISPSAAPGPAIASAAPTPRGVFMPGPSVGPKIPVAPAAPRLRAGVALAPDGATLTTAEVLRGRLVYFWPRAFANDVAVPIRSWRLVSAQPDHISASSGGVEPLAAQWIQMPASGVRWSLRFEITTEIAPTERLEAEISITVRSPALID
jgi:hypothetical protein